MEPIDGKLTLFGAKAMIYHGPVFIMSARPHSIDFQVGSYSLNSFLIRFIGSSHCAVIS